VIGDLDFCLPPEETRTIQQRNRHANLRSHIAMRVYRSFYDRALAIDVREYDPYVIAEVTVSGSTMKEATSKGFSQVNPGAFIILPVAFGQESAILPHSRGL
jgi:hypothetical protein